MECMPKYVLLVILMVFAIASTADADGDTTYTAALGDVKNHIESRCIGDVRMEDYIALIPQHMWPQHENGDIGSANDCIFVMMACQKGLGSCKNALDRRVVIQVVGAVTDDTRGDVEDDGNTVLLSKVAFEALADKSDSRITISYKPQ